MNTEGREKVVASIAHKALTFQDFLFQLYTHKAKKNPKYSVRAFADRLNCSHGYLRNIFKGFRPPSEEFINKVSTALEMDKSFVAKFLQARKDQSLGGNPIVFNQLNEAASEYLSDFKRLSVFLYYGVFAGQIDENLMAQQIGLSLDELVVTRDCLLDVGMLEKDDAGKIVVSPTNGRFYDKVADRNTPDPLACSIFENLKQDYQDKPFEGLAFSTRLERHEVDKVVKSSIAKMMTTLREKSDAKKLADKNTPINLYVGTVIYDQMTKH